MGLLSGYLGAVFGGFGWHLRDCLLETWDVYYFMDWLTLFWVLDLILVAISDIFVY